MIKFFMMKKSIIVITIVFLSLIISANAMNQYKESVCQVTQQNFSTSQCLLQAANQSWMSWFLGYSRSMQFHFIDLIELLYRNTSFNQQNESE